MRGTVAATPFLQELVVQARAANACLPSFRFFACGGAAVPAEIVRGANEWFGATVAFRAFGASEVPLVTVGYPHDAERAAITDGEVVDYEVRVVDEVGCDLPPGAEGEILARGPAMFMGYADEAQTREAIDADGYFRTGDLGIVTADGALLVTGRKKDLIIRGGENISAKEIEDVLLPPSRDRRSRRGRHAARAAGRGRVRLSRRRGRRTRGSPRSSPSSPQAASPRKSGPSASR